MNYKPTFASVTDLPCTCNYLQNAADDPANPIVFDKDTNEFQFKYCDTQCDPEGNCQAMLVIYHCPFCGGAAPRSKRELLFAKIPPDEEARLASLLAPIQTMSDAVDTFGTPDYDDYSVSRCPEDDDSPPRTVYHREVRFYTLSDVADVWISERPDGKVFWQLQGKYIDRNDGGT